MGLLVRGPVATAVDQEQGLGGVGQRDDQRMVAPHPLVGDIHPLLAPAVGGGERAVGVDERLVEEGVGLLLPGPQPGLVEGVHQLLDVALGEAAAEVPGGGRVGEAFGPEGVEVDLVVAADLEVLRPSATGQEVVGDVQDVVALVVGQMSLQEVELLARCPRIRPSFLARRWMGADAARRDAPDLLGDLVVDVGGGDHRLGPLDAGPVLDAAGDPPLASAQPARGGPAVGLSGPPASTTGRRPHRPHDSRSRQSRPGGTPS